MAQLQTFGDLLEAVDNLSVEDQEAFLEVLRRRVVEQRRERIALEIDTARREFQSGQCHPVSVDELAKEILT